MTIINAIRRERRSRPSCSYLQPTHHTHQHAYPTHRNKHSTTISNQIAIAYHGEGVRGDRRRESVESVGGSGRRQESVRSRSLSRRSVVQGDHLQHNKTVTGPWCLLRGLKTTCGVSVIQSGVCSCGLTSTCLRTLGGGVDGSCSLALALAPNPPLLPGPGSGVETDEEAPPLPMCTCARLAATAFRVSSSSSESSRVITSAS